MKQEKYMSLDYASHTSNSGAQSPNELVPSRYALQIGDIDVLVISDGVPPLPTAMLAHKSTRPSGRPGWTTCSCRRIRSIGR